MNIAIKIDLTDNQLEQLNCVRQWFNVKYLSELCNEEGTMIRPGILNSSHMRQKYIQDNNDPKQTKQNTYCWKF